MKIAFLEINATTSFGGVQTGVWSLAREFAREGHDVTVLGGNGRVRPPCSDRIHTLTFPYVARHSFPKFGVRFPIQKAAERISFALNPGLRTAVRSGRFDWVILHKPLDFFWPWIPGIPRITRFALMSGGTDFLPLDRRLASRVSRLVGCSNFNAWQLHERFHRRVGVCHYGVDTEAFSPKPHTAQSDEGEARRSKAVVFGFAGRLVDWKGLDVAIRAIAIAGKEHPMRLALAGDGHERAKWERLASEVGVTSQVSFPGPLNHAAVPEFYANCDAGIFPSIADEAFGIAIAETMSCGKPVIASYIGGIPEVVGNEGSCGLLVSPGDVYQLAAGMRRIAASAELRQRCGENARRRVQERFTWRRSAETLLGELTYGGERYRSGRMPGEHRD